VTATVLAVLASAPLALGLAAGFNLYAAVLGLGLAARAGWITPLPPSLYGLENAFVIAAAALLLLIESIVERLPLLDSVWAACHLLLKPAAAALLTLPFLTTASTGARFAAAAAAALLALLAHGSRGVLRASLQRTRRRLPELALYTVQTAAAVVLALTWRVDASLATIIGVAALAWIALAGPRSWRMLRFTLRAQITAITALGGRHRGTDAGHLPVRLKRLLPSPAPGKATPTCFPATVRRLAGANGYRFGWLVLGPDAATFFCRSLLRSRRMELGAVRSASITTGPWFDTLDIACQHGRCTLLLLKDLAHLASTLRQTADTP
jgi:Domain of unknown function (DUF4126)